MQKTQQHEPLSVIALPRAFYQNGVIQSHPSKTGAVVRLPVETVICLSQRLEDEFLQQKKGNVTATSLIVAESTRCTYKGDHFRHVVKRIRDQAAKKWPPFGNLQFM